MSPSLLVPMGTHTALPEVAYINSSTLVGVSAPLLARMTLPGPSDAIVRAAFGSVVAVMTSGDALAWELALGHGGIAERRLPRVVRERAEHQEALFFGTRLGGARQDVDAVARDLLSQGDGEDSFEGDRLLGQLCRVANCYPSGRFAGPVAQRGWETHGA